MDCSNEQRQPKPANTVSNKARIIVEAAIACICGKPKPEYRCSRCNCTRYCSYTCQRAHWWEHKEHCFDATDPKHAHSHIPLYKAMMLHTLLEQIRQLVDGAHKRIIIVAAHCTAEQMLGTVEVEIASTSRRSYKRSTTAAVDSQLGTYIRRSGMLGMLKADEILVCFCCKDDAAGVKWNMHSMTVPSSV